MTESESLALRAVVARVLPAGETTAGAAEAGVAEYLEAALEEPGARAWRPLFARGLAFLDEMAREHHGGRISSFASLPPADQDRLLGRLAERSEPWARQFFELLVAFTLEGFLCDPRRGGNRAGLGWKTLGISPPGRCSTEPA